MWACSRWYPCGAPARPRCLHRRQASSHWFCGGHKNRGQPRTSVGAGLLAMAALRCASQTALFASQASQLPQVLRWSQKPGSAAYLCGSGLARDSSTSVIQIHRVARIASKPAPTGQSLKRLPPRPPRPQTTSYPAPGAAPGSRCRPVPAARPRPALPQRPESADVPCCDQRSTP